MSRGTKLTPLRLSDDILARIDEAITSNNACRPGEPYNRTSWIRQAIEERLAKLERGRRSGPTKKRKGKAVAGEAVQGVGPGEAVQGVGPGEAGEAGEADRLVAGEAVQGEAGPDIDATLFGWEPNPNDPADVAEGLEHG